MKTFFARAALVILIVLILVPFATVGVLARWIVGSFLTGWDAGEGVIDTLGDKANGY